MEGTIQNSIEENREIKKGGLNLGQLKWIAMATMLIDHIGAIILMPLLSKTPRGSAIREIYTITRVIGRTAFPKFCFALAEGYNHTRNKYKYLIRLLIFAIISEIPFDYANSGKFFNWEYQNVLFTLSIGLIAMILIDLPKKGVLINLLIVYGAMALAQYMYTDYGPWGVANILLFKYIRLDRTGRALANSAINIYQGNFGTNFSSIALYYYNGDKGYNPKWFYLFYPVHQIIYALIRDALI